MTVHGRRMGRGLLVVAVLGALTAGCTVRTDERAAAPDGPTAATDAVEPDVTLAASPTSTGPSTTTTAPDRALPSTTTSTTEAPLTGWAATDAYLLRRIIGGG